MYYVSAGVSVVSAGVVSVVAALSAAGTSPLPSPVE